ncbi:MAG: hypothetical protein AAF533_22790 [Acidobacteriota bacterium]
MPSSAVGVLNEGPLHAALKEWYRRPGDRVEQPLDGFVIDLVRGETLIEIQTQGFSAMRRKLDCLLDDHQVRVVHPVAVEKWIVKLGPDGQQASRRKSPLRSIAADACSELVSFPTLLSHPNFRLELVLIQEDEVRSEDRRRGRRRGGWVVEERRLVDVVDHLVFSRPDDLLALLPAGLPESFTTQELADELGRHRRQAQDVIYCLRTADVIHAVSRDRRGIHYRIGPAPTP